MKKKSSEIDIGLGSKDRERIVIGLCVVLADTYALYFKTRNFHWNVTGEMFQTLQRTLAGNGSGG